jgi:adenylate kinase family enzyme
MIKAANDSIDRNAQVLERELAWLSSVIDAAISIYLGNECRYRDVREIAPPPIEEPSSPYGTVVCKRNLSFDERCILALTLTPHVRPQLLDRFLVKNPNIDRSFTEFGGLITQAGFVPTVETAAFVLGGGSLERRFEVQAALAADQTLRSGNLVNIDDTVALFASPLGIGKEFLDPFTTGNDFHPNYSSAFPAQRLTTAMQWSDLVLADSTMEEIEEIRAWIEHRDVLLQDWELSAKIKPGLQSLFYGPPGTGKTLTASLLGNATGLDVYRIDLSQMVSKWIGETEKNLAGLFREAERRDWILFFDEADALFGKRTQTSSSHDRYANQEVSYLLQRVEDFPGIVILASNLKSNIDEAFARRFHSMIYFPMPSVAERLRLWTGAFSEPSRLDPSIDFQRLATEFELSGGAIRNVLRYASLMAVRREIQRIRLNDIREGIRREYRKSGKVL